MVSECPRCGSLEFVINDLPDNNISMSCAFCKAVFCITADNSVNETDDIVSKYEKVLELTKPGSIGGFKIVSME